MIAVKNWQKFQHYKHRKPPWLRLYRDLIDDPEYHGLSGEAAKHLILLWVLASEDPIKEGKLPLLGKIAFRLRIDVGKLSSIIRQLSHWVKYDASDLLADCKQHATSETETETEGEKSKEKYTKEKPPIQSDLPGDGKPCPKPKPSPYPSDFVEWYKDYPRKEGKDAALREWKKVKKHHKWPGLLEMRARLSIYKRSPNVLNGYVLKPAKYLKDGHWMDEAPRGAPGKPANTERLTAAEQQQRRNREILEAIEAREGK